MNSEFRFPSPEFKNFETKWSSSNFCWLWLIDYYSSSPDYTRSTTFTINYFSTVNNTFSKMINKHKYES